MRNVRTKRVVAVITPKLKSLANAKAKEVGLSLSSYISFLLAREVNTSLESMVNVEATRSIPCSAPVTSSFEKDAELAAQGLLINKEPYE